MDETDQDRAGSALRRAEGSDAGYVPQRHEPEPGDSETLADRHRPADLLASEALRTERGDLFRRIARNLDAFRQDSSWARSRNQADPGEPAAAEAHGEGLSSVAALGARVEAIGQSLDALQRAVAPRMAQVQSAELAPLQALVDAVVAEMQRLRSRSPAVPMSMMGAESNTRTESFAGSPANRRPSTPAASGGPAAAAPAASSRRQGSGRVMRPALLGLVWLMPVLLSGALLLQHYPASGSGTGRSARPSMYGDSPALGAPAVPSASVSPIPSAVPAAKPAPPQIPAGAPPVERVAHVSTPAASAAAASPGNEPPRRPKAHAPSGRLATGTDRSASEAGPAASQEASPTPVSATPAGSVAARTSRRVAESPMPRSWVDLSARETHPAAPMVIGPDATPPPGLSHAPATAGGTSPAGAAPSVVPIVPAVAPGPAGVTASAALPPASAAAPPGQVSGSSASQPAPPSGSLATSQAAQVSVASSGGTIHPVRTPAARPPPPARSAAIAAGAASLQVRAIADAWVQVHDAKGRLVFGRLMHAGESWTAPDQPGLLLTTGNAGGTEVVIGSVASAPLGATGAVLHDVPLGTARASSASPPSHGTAPPG